MENELQLVAKEATEFQSSLAPIVVASSAEYSRAGDAVNTVSKKLKELEAKRMTMTRPLDESKRLIMEEFKKLTVPLDEFVTKTKQSMIAFHRAEEVKAAEAARIEREKAEAAARAEADKMRVEAEQRAKEAVAEGVPDILMDTEPAAPAPQPVYVPEPVVPKTTYGQQSTTTLRENWQFEITNPELVPREYLSVEPIKIKMAIRTQNVRDIPGVRIYDAGSIATR